MSGYVRTMADLEAATYGVSGGSGNSLLKASGFVGGFGGNVTNQSGHDGLAAVSGTAAGIAGSLYGVLYGQKVWSMLNREVNAFSMIAKRPYTSSGWRILTDRPTGGSGSLFGEMDATSGLSGAGAISANNDIGKTVRADQIGGVGENHSLDSTGLFPIAPKYAKLFVSPKTVAHMFSFSELAIEMAKIDDGVGDIRALIREDMAKHHAEVQNKMLLMPLQQYNAHDTGANNDDLIMRNYTSLMKIVSSAAEIAAMANADYVSKGISHSGSGAEVAVSPNLTDLFGATRVVTAASDQNPYTSTASYLDAEVDFGDGYAATDGRPLTLTLLNSMIRKLRVAGGNPKVILTGYDTIQHIGDLLQSQERFMDSTEIVPTHNGVKGVKGSEVGFRVATYYGIPLIPCKDMPQTGNYATNKLSDMLFLDTDHLWMSMMKPTEYFEDGIDNGNPFGVGTLGNKALYRTIGETCCSFFKGQGKITNLQSA
mgnify:CR=1 FL=1|tara:strand:+ start:475 stop:1923 length:1449 start_codon:yes stop_codon:yes gene_type:complete